MRHKVGRPKKRAVGRVTHHKKTTRRKRRVSGIGGNLEKSLMKAAGVIAGTIAARELNTIIVKQFPEFSPLMSGLMQVGVGFVLPMVVKGNEFVSDMGLGMMGNGGMVAVVATGIISGPNDDNRLIQYQVRGVNGLQMVAGPTSRIGNDDGAQLSMTAGTRRGKHVY